MLREIWKSFIRTASFTGKELREVARRPGVLLSLVFGPLLIMLIFGVGYTGYRRPFDTEIVVPKDTSLPTDESFYQDVAPGYVHVVGITNDREAAERDLRQQKIDLVVEVPENAASNLQQGKQAELGFAWNVLDPTDDALAHLATSSMVSSINAEIIRRAAKEGISIAGGNAGQQISPDVIAQPTTAKTANVAPTQPDVIDYFSPAVLALVLQHLAVTLAALSLIRERLSGQLDLFRVAPVNSTEVLVGKYVAYGFLSLALGGILGVLLVTVLGVPLLGGVLPVVGIIGLLTFASLGLGLFISLIADSERQAVQLSMLVLLASVFFSGFMLPVGDFVDWVQTVSFALPVTHGIETLQQSMLRGGVTTPWMLGALGAIGVLLFVACLWRTNRVLRSVPA